MHIIRSETSQDHNAPGEAQEAERYALMMEEVLIDIDDLDHVACPPDRRILLGNREAWIYEHGNVSELVYVKVGED